MGLAPQCAITAGSLGSSADRPFGVFRKRWTDAMDALAKQALQSDTSRIGMEAGLRMWPRWQESRPIDPRGQRAW
jgi:hypothetical protein